MHFTLRIDGAAHITVHGEIDHSTVPTLRAAAAELPPNVTELVWELQDAHLMDIAGLHLLFEQPSPEGPPRKTTVTSLAPQPLRLPVLTTEVNPPPNSPTCSPMPSRPLCLMSDNHPAPRRERIRGGVGPLAYQNIGRRTASNRTPGLNRPRVRSRGRKPADAV